VNIFLALPRAKHHTDEDLNAVRAWASQKHFVDSYRTRSALITYNCNGLLATALNERATHGWSLFAMLHYDIRPQQFWLDVLVDQLICHSADWMSAVVPLTGKDNGYTSTALAESADRLANRRRLTQSQLHHPRFPETFDVQMAALAIEQLPPPYRISQCPRGFLWCNTGCFVVRIDRDWDWTTVCFASDDRLVLSAGRYLEYVFPEDWTFSHRVAEAGGKVMATRLVKLTHTSEETGKQYRSDEVWGHPVDLGHST
jgi:hypothetical protein